MLFIFDLDGTLIESYMQDGVNAHPYERVQARPGIVNRLADVMECGHTVAIVTNQGGVAFGLVSEQMFQTKLARALVVLGLPSATPFAVCYALAHPRAIPPYNDLVAASRRKPSGAMLVEMMNQCGEAPHRTVFIGDRPEDEAAAKDADCLFCWIDSFIQRP